ncbi:MAG: hypothetical protein ACRYGR_04840 [Janthinobacterium lividum]
MKLIHYFFIAWFMLIISPFSKSSQVDIDDSNSSKTLYSTLNQNLTSVVIGDSEYEENLKIKQFLPEKYGSIDDPTSINLKREIDLKNLSKMDILPIGQYLREQYGSFFIKKLIGFTISSAITGILCTDFLYTGQLDLVARASCSLIDMTLLGTLGWLSILRDGHIEKHTSQSLTLSSETIENLKEDSQTQIHYKRVYDLGYLTLLTGMIFLPLAITMIPACIANISPASDLNPLRLTCTLFIGTLYVAYATNIVFGLKDHT